MDYAAFVVADDLTGAADTGHRLAARGHDVVVTSEPTEPPGDVLVRTTESRSVSPPIAADRVQRAIDDTSASLVYKKIDSTLRGNVVAEVDAAMAATEAEVGLVVPAFPAEGRTTVGDRHLVDGAPVTLHEGDRGGESTPETASLTGLLSPSVSSVAHLPIETVAAGPDAILERLRDIPTDEPLLVACDAARSSHLGAIASAGASVDQSVLYVGSAGLAGHVDLGADAPALGVVGSTAPETLAAIESLPTGQVVELDGPRLFTNRERVIAQAVERADTILARQGRAVLTAATTRSAVEATLEAGRDAGNEPPSIRAAVASALAETATRVVERETLGGLFLTGGATATEVLDELSADRVRLTGRAVQAGIPVGVVEGGDVSGVPLVTKAGGFGDAETILRCLDTLAAYDA